MSNSLRLIQNENMKLYRKKSTLLIIVFFILFMVLVSFLIHNSSQSSSTLPANYDWKSQLTQENSDLIAQKQMPAANRPPLEYINDRIALNKYRLDHNLTPAPPESMATFTLTLSSFTLLVFVFVIISAGSVVSSEFNSGTVKLWMSRPVKRSQLLVSKYVSQLLFMAGLMVLLAILGWALGLFFYGFSGWNTPVLMVHHAHVTALSATANIWLVYLLHFCEGLFVLTFAFMLSTITHNTAIAIALTLFLTLTKEIVLSLSANYHWLTYYPFIHLNLQDLLMGQSSSFGNTTHSPTFSIVLLVVYYVLFLAVTWITFNRRDVA